MHSTRFIIKNHHQRCVNPERPFNAMVEFLMQGAF